ncbi:glycolipid transfer protein domain-containing protein [Lentinula raphanica]|uniref:Glycolipid transfer protein domain-containing protein n=1 Tax=Lentinula raphanica TaxID=153919 RepID=A0AA38P5S0_9AGAR|nr:glycolipid transfer protein domain-containing protein [Lentinula raphanica]KAJ3759173.1 glycolipid transfer protein domain-containing protein [Lentinula raphanica]KAJ3768626.1 glycolipid transfer protein domain-containing protein [Lentinula raphanica]KAJ3825361.1 glycolipid transfer protein domain-containing protein [Lentinula raphanica]KAJ3836799.1 glycolipid transfer protein domain-containing protein [Lentinula raphanica]
MAPYFETIRSFADVPVTDAGVDTLAFLEASEGVLGIFDLLGSTAFAPVVSDLKGNIVKVRTRYDAAPAQSATLEELVKNEQGEKKRTATGGLMWLLRGLAFTCAALLNAQANKTEELSVAFTNGYDRTLKQFHNFIVKGIFSVAMKACPYRRDFYAKLASDPSGGPAASESALNEQLDKWLAALDLIVKRMETFYEKHGYNKGV